MFEGEVVDVEGLAAELKTFWKAAGFTGKRFSVGIANQKIVVRTMEFPMIDPKELRAAIEFQAQEAIPIPLNEAILDYQVLSTTPGETAWTRRPCSCSPRSTALSSPSTTSRTRATWRRPAPRAWERCRRCR
jgi:hypothetical protein